MQLPNIAASIVFMLVLKAQGQLTPTLTVQREGSTGGIPSYLPEGTRIVLSCNRVLNVDLSRLLIYSKTSITDNSDEVLGGCIYNQESINDVNPERNGSIEILNCDSNDASITYQLGAIVPYSFYCVSEDLSQAANDGDSDEFISPKSYVAADLPTFVSDPSIDFTEGQNVIYTCSSAARPPPVLRLFIVGVSNTPTFGVVNHDPLVDDITESSPFATSVLTWTVAVSQDLAGRQLVCRLQHISGDKQSADLAVKLIYGPSNATVQPRNVNVDGPETELVLSCSLSSYPSPSYAWYTDSISGTVISTSQELSINFADYRYLTSGTTLTVEYICVATNPTSLQIAYQTSPLTLSSNSPTVRPGPVKGSASLPWWAWLLIALCIIVVIGAVILVAIIAKRRKSSPTSKKKKMAKVGKTNALAMGSSGSLQRQQSDIIRARSPGDQPSSPKLPPRDNIDTGSPDPNSPSHTPGYVGKVEDYANAFDAQPRSRRPIALNDLDQLDTGSDQGEPPSYTGYPDYSRNSTYNPREPYGEQPQQAEPPYNARDSSYYSPPQEQEQYQRDSYNPRNSHSQYNSYNKMNSGEGSFNMGYGAPC